MRKFHKLSIGIAAASLLVVGLAGCSAPADTDTETDTPDAPAAEADPTPLASIPALDGVDTQVTLDAGFLEAITSLGLTPGVIGTATLSPEGVLAFPITGGNVDYYDPEEDYRPYVQGSVEHDGSGISLDNGTIKVDLTDFRIDPGTSQLFATVEANGELVGNDVYLFNLDGTTLNPLSEDADGNAVLEGTTVLISPDAAALLNETYGTDAVTDELVVGIAKITAKAAA